MRHSPPGSPTSAVSTDLRTPQHTEEEFQYLSDKLYTDLMESVGDGAATDYRLMSAHVARGMQSLDEFENGGAFSNIDMSGIDLDRLLGPNTELDPSETPVDQEELALYSVFLSGMEAFERFLGGLSLSQLRQCAATVNSVLVQRESAAEEDEGFTREPSIDTQTPAEAAGDQSTIPQSMVSYLRESLEGPTASKVIAALQAARLEQTLIPTEGTAKRGGSGPAARHAGPAGTNEPALDTDVEGTPILSFMYAQKGELRRHQIRVDIERAPLVAIPPSFQQNNCVYPRANCAKSTYAGNRWSYETECNRLGWRLAFLNQELLTGRRGLLQTAVNNYRSMVAGRKSRRVTRMEKAEQQQGKRPLASEAGQPLAECGGSSAPSEKRAKIIYTPSVRAASDGPSQLPTPPVSAGPAARSSEGGVSLQRPAPSLSQPSSSPLSAKCLLITAFVNNRFARIRIQIDIGAVVAGGVDDKFKKDHAVFPRALRTPRWRYTGAQQQGRWEFELVCNELAWRLAWLNRARLRDRKPLIQKCLDAYRQRFRAPPWSLLVCFEESMGGSVDPKFYDLWRPRSRRHRVPRRPGTSEDDAQCEGALADDSLVVPVSSAPPSSATAPAACRPQLSKAAAPSVEAGPSAPARGPRPVPSRSAPTGPVSVSAGTASSSSSSPSTPGPPRSATSTPRPAPTTSNRTARAQAAADMLSDVFRQLAKSDPSLTLPPGVLGTLRAAEDDGVPLDAKVAELEKLIIDLRRS
ncbi:hypothetical protein GGF46_005477 [Coemansia sp. RSA 552]|nr:hypothetical protein GGF46_005477 [Coemansia sp. RSA 552]